MPIPTDTFWNIKRLNWIFFISCVAMMGTFGWAILQDWGKTWREPQRQGRIWEAALIDERVHRAMSPEVKARIAALDKQIAAAEAELLTHKDYTDLLAAIKGYEGSISNLSVEYNNLKAEVTVRESNLEKARTAGDAKGVREIQDAIKTPKAKVDDQARTIAEWKNSLSEARIAKKDKRVAVDKLIKERKDLTDIVEALEKKEAALVPDNPLAFLSEKVRGAPLMQFINPSERVQQVVLPDIRMDVSFTRIDTIDRCATCHVHISDKRFTKEKVLGYLEEEAAAVHGNKYISADKAKPTDPTSVKPGATANAAFWHLWGRRLLKKPGATEAKISGQITAIAKAASKLPNPPALLARYPKFVTEAPTTQPIVNNGAVSDRDQLLLDVIAQLYAIDPNDEILTKTPALASGRTAALAYPGRVRDLLKAEMPAEEFRLLEDRYRADLVRIVNAARKKQGLAALDTSPAQLAHPNLELYVDQDSPHGMEVIGCTSCHDGSGNETDFVLAAHSARAIWVDDQSGEPVLATQLKNPPMRKVRPTLDSMLRAVWPEGEAIPSKLPDLHLSLPDAVDVVETEPSEEAPSTQYVDPVTGQTHRALPQGKYWANTYEAESGWTFETAREMWDYPMRTPEYLQANCARCHNNFHDIKEEAPVLYEGRQLFAKLGCVNCHQMDSIPVDDAKDPHSGDKRQVGTDLRHISAKLSPAFVNTWIWAPKAFRPSTMMPHFFMAENSSSDEELRRTRQEARAITEYLFQTATPLPIAHPIAPGAQGSAEKGAILFEQVGCMGCHTNLNHIQAGDKVSLGEKWITTDLAKRGGVLDADPMLTEQLRKDLLGKLTKELLDKSIKKLKKPPTTAQADQLATTALADAKIQAEKDLPAIVAKSKFDAMTYNERQMYALENLGEVSSLPEQGKYPDGKTAKPVFMHHGPELSGIGDKLATGRTPEEARAWLFDWVKEPRHYSAYTVMPRLRLDDQQAMDLVAYLLAQHRATVPTKDAKGEIVPDRWQATEVSPDGKKLSELAAFFLRSQFSDATADRKAADPAEMKTRAADALAQAFTARLNADESSRERLPSEKQAMAKKEANATVKEMSLPQAQLVFLGGKLIAHYGCMNCHAINGMESVASPCANLSDWGQKDVAKLDFGYLDPHQVHSLPETYTLPMVNGLSVAAVTDVNKAIDAKEFDERLSANVTAAWPHIEHAREAWITQKLKNTRIWDRGRNLLEPVRKTHGDRPDSPPEVDSADGSPILARRGKPYDKLKMPNFYLNDEQIHELVTFVISNRARLISDKLLARVNNEDALRIAKGRQITERYNCVSCHQIESNFPAVRQYYKPDDWNALAPPSLRGEGNKIQHNWLYGFLHNVIPIRPLPHIRMPSFPISDDEARSVAAYFAAASNHEAAVLKKKFEQVNKDTAIAVQTELEVPVGISLEWVQIAGDPAKVAATKGALLLEVATKFANFRPGQAAAALRRTVALDATVALAGDAEKAKAKASALLLHAGAQLAVRHYDDATATLTLAQALAAAFKLKDETGSAPLADALNDAITTVAGQKVPDMVPFPNDGWHAQDKYVAEAAYLREWSVSHGQMPDNQFDPSKSGPQELGRNYRTALFKANFTQELYESPFPFVDASRPEMEGGDFKRGETFFYQMQCLGCHVLGDPTAKGATKAPQAPNLNLAFVRLQPRWIEHWVQEPGVIQINTKMPPFMTGLGAFDLTGQAWPLAQGGTPEQTAEILAAYHTKTKQEQKDLLVGFLFEAGRRSYTAVQPVGEVKPPAMEASPGTAQPIGSSMHPATSNTAATPPTAGGINPTSGPKPPDTEAVKNLAHQTPGAKPVTPGTKPVTPGTKPVTPGTQPVTPGSKPVTPGTKPVTPATKSVTPATKPVTPATKRVTPATKPGK